MAAFNTYIFQYIYKYFYSFLNLIYKVRSQQNVFDVSLSLYVFEKLIRYYINVKYIYILCDNIISIKKKNDICTGIKACIKLSYMSDFYKKRP